MMHVIVGLRWTLLYSRYRTLIARGGTTVSKKIGPRRRRRFGYIRRLPSKMWHASYLAPDGLRHNAPTTFQTKGDAEAWIATQQAMIIEHRWRPASETATVIIALRDYAGPWLA